MTESLVVDRAREELLEVRAYLAETNARIAVVKRALRHRHDDDAWFAVVGDTPAALQREREALRWPAHVAHVFLANRRGRIHGAFESIDEQREWLARNRR